MESSNNMSLDLWEGDETAEKDRIPITPWGSRFLLTCSYWPEGRPLEVAVTIDRGQFRVRVTNNLPFSLPDSRLILGAWTRGRHPYTGQDGNHDFYQIINLRPVDGKGGRTEVHVKAKLSANNGQFGNSVLGLTSAWKLEHRTGMSGMLLPRVNVRGRLVGYLVAKVQGTPSLRIGPSSFESDEGTHLIVQRITSENLPPPEFIINELPPKGPRPPGEEESGGEE